MKKNTTKCKVIRMTILAIVSLLVVIGPTYYIRNVKGSVPTTRLESFLNQSLPKPIKTHIANKELKTGEVDENLKRIDDVLIGLDKINLQTSPGANQLRLFLEKPWAMDYLFIASVVCLFFIFIISIWRTFRRKLYNKWYWIMIPLIVLLAFLDISHHLDDASKNQVDDFFVFICFLSIGVAVIAIVQMLIKFLDKKFSSQIRLVRREHRQNTLLWAAIAGWSLAYLCFFIGMYAAGTQKSALAAIFRPALSACKMFFLADSPADFSAALRLSGGFMGFYTIVKIIVLTITTSTLISLIFYRWKASLDINFEHAEGKKLYVFFGITRVARILAKDIRAKEEESVIVFVENREEKSNLFNSVSFSSVLGLLRHRGGAYEIADEVDAHLIISNVMMSSPECSELLSKDAPTSIQLMMNNLGLKHFYCLAKDAKETHCFFMYDDQNINISGSYNLRKFLNKSFYDSDKKFKIHCWARPSAKTQMLEIPEEETSVWLYQKTIKEKVIQCYHRLSEYLQTLYKKLCCPKQKDHKQEQKVVSSPKYDTEIEILDSSHLSVQLLMQNPECHPIRFVDVDTDTATVKNRFEALIIGFGETGQDTLKFLYEFGAFMHHECSENDSEETARTAITVRSPFHCDVIDSNMSMLKAEFMHNAPAVANAFNMQKKSGKWKPNLEDPLVSFHQAKYNSQEFIDLIEERITKVNYIVLALGSDELNLTVLNDLMEIAVRKREKGYLGELTIFVRSYLYSNNEAMKQMASYYNNLGYGDENIKRIKREHVIIFGEEHQLFSFKNIIRDEIVSHAKEYFRRYEELRTNKEKNKDIWDKRHNNYKILSWEIRKKVKRQEQQDINNSLHAKTKYRLISNHDIPVLFKEIADAIIFEEGGKPIQFSTSDIAIKRICTNLARTEHLRWNASHEMSGYIMNESTGCNEMNKTHNCLVPWEILPKVTSTHNKAEDQKKPEEEKYYVDYQAYDYLVVKTTFDYV